MGVNFNEIDAAIQTLCPEGYENAELYCNSIRSALARAKVDIIGKDITENGYSRFKNYLVKHEDPYAWFAVDIIYTVLTSIYEYEPKEDESFTLFDKQVRALSNIKHFEDLFDMIETTYKCKYMPGTRYLGRMDKYNQAGISGKEMDSPSSPNDHIIHTDSKQKYMNMAGIKPVADSYRFGDMIYPPEKLKSEFLEDL